MDLISKFRTVEAWRSALGLLPVPLRDSAEKQERYVLLNGTSGNFCLDFVGDIDLVAQRAAAWSCDVGHYVMSHGDSVVVSRWDKQSGENYSWKSVISQIHDFHRHLEREAPDRSRSIVVHVLRVFHRIRAVLGNEDNGLRSLRVLLHLLASAAAGSDRPIDTNLEIWGLNAEIIEPTRSIAAGTWGPLYDDLVGVGRYDVLRPDFQLVLRHTSGAVFQDAHLEANNSSAYWLPGFECPATVRASAVPAETGIYFTPPALARTLAEEAIRSILHAQGDPHRTLTVFDPACGSGELLKETLRLLGLREYSGRVRLVGWDRSPAAVDMSRFVLSWEKRTWLEGQIEIDIAQRDSLVSSWPENVDVVVMNPPFRSWQLMDAEQQHVVGQMLSASTKPNLAMAFARRAVDSLRGGGVLAMITPNSLLEGNSGAECRQVMADFLTAILVARLGDQSLFARALVDAGLYVGMRKPAVAESTAVVWADTRQNSLSSALRGLRRWRGAEVEPLNGKGYSIYVRSDVAASGGPWVARRYEAWSQYQRFQNDKRMLSAEEVFDIRQGIRLGNDVFIVGREYVKALPKSEQRFFRPAVMNPSVCDGRLVDDYYAFYPYTTGLPVISTEHDLQNCVPKYFKDHLVKAKSALKARKTLKQSSLNWWDLLRSRSWQLKQEPKLVSKYFGGRRSFALDAKGDFVVVVGHAWLLRRSVIGRRLADAEVYRAALAYLSSSIAYDMLDYVSVQVAGGQLDLSNKYISRLPVPDLAKLRNSDLAKLIQAGTAISQGQVQDWAGIDDLVVALVGG